MIYTGKDQIECILNSHPEWSRKCIEMQRELILWPNMKLAQKIIYLQF